MIAVMSLGRAKLSELCKLVTDGTHDTPKIVSQGVPLIKGKDISRGRVDFSVCDLISIEDHKQIIKRSKPERGDTLFANIGNSLGDVAYVETDQEFSIKNVALFKPNSAVTIPRYLFYLLKSPVVQSGLLSQRSGAAQPFLGLAALRGFEVDYHHDLETQRRIASILGAYDDLIEVNRRRVAILEEMARGLFDEWFVRFRFPGHESVPMVATAEGLLPDGWRYGQLGALIRLHYGKALKADGRRPGKVSVIGSSGVVGEHDVALVRAPGIVVGRKGNVGSVIWSHHDFWPIDTTYYVQTTTPLAFAYELLRRVPFQNTDAAVPGLNRDYALSRIVVIPATETVEKFGIFAQPLRDQVERLTRVNRALEASRDLLLPRLISGQLSVEAAERELEAAA